MPEPERVPEPERIEQVAPERAVRGRAGCAFVGYLGVSLLLFGLPVLRDLGSRFVGMGSRDARLYVWDLSWWPHAIASGLNPFHPTVVWAPSGVNMAWVTGLPGPALLMAPLTELVGGVVSSNVLAILAPALGAWAAFLLCREVTGALWPSVAGGYLFGFSTYEIGQMLGHVNLFLVFPVPLAVYLVVRFANGGLSRRRFVWMLAAVLVAEFSISTEVFATLSFFGTVAIVGALAFAPEFRARARELLPPIGLAFALAAIPLAPYLWYAVQGPPPALANGVPGTSVDALSYLVPRPSVLIGGPWFEGLTQAFRANVSEDGAYLTPALLVVLGVILIAGRRDRTTKLLSAFTGTAALLSFGDSLQVHGHKTIPLPWRVLGRAPLLKDALPERFTMYVWLGVSVIVARWLAAPVPGGPWRRWVPRASVGLAAILLLPNVLLPNLHRRSDVPPFFATGIYRGFLSPGETIFIIHARVQEGDEMLWQARTDFAFRMPQGHTGPEPAPFANDPVWQNLRPGQPFGVTADQLRSWLDAHGVRDVVVSAAVGPRWRPLLIATTGAAPRRVGGIVLYGPLAAGAPGLLTAPSEHRSASRRLTS